MSGDWHTYILGTETDGSISGKHSHQHELDSVVNSDWEEVEEEVIEFKDRVQFDEWVKTHKNIPYQQRRTSIHLDGVQLL